MSSPISKGKSKSTEVGFCIEIGNFPQPPSKDFEPQKSDVS